MSQTTNHPKRQGEEHHGDPAPKQTAAPAGEQQQPGKAPEPKRTPQDWDTLINKRIEEAMRDGAFDNLRNKGKPLDTAPEPHVPPDMQMANSLLKNNDLAPAWISDRSAVLGAIERFREKLRTVATDFATARTEATTPQRREQLDQMWQAYVESWRAEVIDLNKRILTQNLKQPVTFLEIFPLRLDEELKKVL